MKDDDQDNFIPGNFEPAKVDLSKLRFSNGKDSIKRGLLALQFLRADRCGEPLSIEIQVWIDMQAPESDFQDITIKDFIDELELIKAEEIEGGE